MPRGTGSRCRRGRWRSAAAGGRRPSRSATPRTRRASTPASAPVAERGGDGTRGHDGRGDSTRAAHAGLRPAADGEPFLPGPTFAAPYHLAGPSDASRFNYGRYDNPTWARLEDALGELEGAQAVVFAAGMAAVSAVVIPTLHTGDVLVAPSDAYPGIRAIARDVLEPNGVEVRLVPTDDEAVRAALPGATLVWLESPSNPGLVVLDLPALIAEAHAA